jgi:hypothetical protein
MLDPYRRFCDVKKLPIQVLLDVATAIDLDECDYLSVDAIPQSSLDKINSMSTMEVLETYLRYNGIIGYTQRILNAVDGVRNAAR